MVTKSGINIIDALLTGVEWNGGAVTYAFPDSPFDYGYSGEPDRNFDSISSSQQIAALFALDTSDGNAANDGFSVEGFTNLDVSPGSDSGADIRLAESSAANPTAYGYYPSANERGGDIWFGTRYEYRNAKAGDYEWATVVHELGHALGLKHAHEKADGFPAIAENRDSLEYTLMTYHSTVKNNNNSYTNELTSFPQTFMMADIAALQYMYGADYTTNCDATTYKWNPGSGDTLVNGGLAIDAVGARILATIWDGGGIDTYDLSSYNTALKIDLAPGGFSVFARSQLADLNSFSPGGLARGSIFNALLHEGDTRSLIENAIGGSGNDRISGNQGGNALTGGGGNDTLIGLAGNDILTGGGDSDEYQFGLGYDTDTIIGFEAGSDSIVFMDLGLERPSTALTFATQQGDDVVFDFGGGDVLILDNILLANVLAPDLFVL